MKDIIYKFLVVGNINGVRFILALTAYITSIILLIPSTLPPNFGVGHVDIGVSIIIWFAAFILFAIISSANLLSRDRYGLLTLFEGAYGFFLWGTSTAYSLLKLHLTVTTAPQLVLTFLAWCVFIILALRK